MTRQRRALRWVWPALLAMALLQPLMAAQAKELKVKVGALLPSLHHQLIRAGWQAAPQRSDPREELIGVEQVLHEAGYTEVSNCAMDAAMCQLSYRHGAKCLTVWVKGEEPAEMRVSKVSRSCQGFIAPSRASQ